MRHSLLVGLFVSTFGLPPATAQEDAGKSLPAKLAPFFRPPEKFAGDFGPYRSPLLRADGSKVTTPEQWRERRAEIAAQWHEFMGPWPPLLAKPKMEILKKERRENFTQHHVRIEVAPGRMTDDAYLLVPDGAGPFPAVVVVYYDAKTGIGLGKSKLRDFALELARRGFVALSLGSPPASYFPSQEKARLQPLSYHAYVAANCYNLLASLGYVDPRLIGILGHSYGGKWALFASCLHEPFACGVWSDPGIVFDEKRGNVNYWEPWYLGHDPALKKQRKPGIPRDDNPRTGPYAKMRAQGRDLHELHVLMAPRPFLVSGGAEDPPARWQALNHALAVNRLLGCENRVAMTNRPTHSPTEESNEQIYLFLEHFLKNRAVLRK